MVWSFNVFLSYIDWYLIQDCLWILISSSCYSYSSERNWRNAFIKERGRNAFLKVRNEEGTKPNFSEKNGAGTKRLFREEHAKGTNCSFFVPLCQIFQFLHENWKMKNPSLKNFLKHSIYSMFNWISFSMQLSYFFYVFAWLLATRKI